jgi:hypothetical protein
VFSNNAINNPNDKGPKPSVNALIPFNAPSASPWLDCSTTLLTNDDIEGYTRLLNMENKMDRKIPNEEVEPATMQH